MTASIHARVGSTPPQRSWSQSPFSIQVPAGTLRANAAMRATNSSRLPASRSCTDESAKPPVSRCTWQSMKPGHTKPPFASITRVSGPIVVRTSASSPTTAISLPRTATAAAQGWAALPVHTRPFTTARVAVASGLGEGAEQPTASEAAIKAEASDACIPRSVGAHARDDYASGMVHRSVLLSFVLGPAIAAQAPAVGLDEQRFAELQRELTPDPAAPWRLIPWRIDLLAAQREAAAQHKPLFLWAMDGHPLGCT